MLVSLELLEHLFGTFSGSIRNGAPDFVSMGAAATASWQQAGLAAMVELDFARSFLRLSLPGATTVAAGTTAPKVVEV